MNKNTKLFLVILLIMSFIVDVAVVAFFIGRNGLRQPQTDKPDNKSEVIAISNTGEAMLAGGTYAMPAGMTFVAAAPRGSAFAPEGEFTITATVDNEYINGVFDFECYFPEGSPEWANGKNAEEYIAVTPVSATTAKVKLLAEFGAPIEIKATLLNTQSSATCRVDYLFRPDWIVNGAFSDILGKDFNSEFTILVPCGSAISTVMGFIELEHLQIALNESFINSFKSYLKFDVTLKTAEVEMDSCLYDGVDNYKINYTLDYSHFIEGFNELDEKHQEAIYYAWYAAYNSDEGYSISTARFSISVNYMYEGRVISNFAQDTSIPGKGRLSISGREKGEGLSPDVELNGNGTL